MGALTLLLPYVQTQEEAIAAVRSVSYGPEGVRGIAGSTRATRYGRVENYFQHAREEICLLVQVETISAIQELDLPQRRIWHIYRPRFNGVSWSVRASKGGSH